MTIAKNASRFFSRRMIWWPTLLGWAGLFTVVVAGLLLWVFKGEAFLSASRPLPTEILVIEGWIGIEGVHAARAEFDRGGYRLLITAGGPTDNRWGRQTWNHAVLAREELIRTGFPSDQVIAAPTQDSANHRTFASAVAVVRILRSKNLHPTSLNIFTSGVHARRSRLVYAKVLTSQTRVGVIAWTSPLRQSGPWWNSSERASDLLKETVGCLYEVFLNSGRTSNSPN